MHLLQLFAALTRPSSPHPLASSLTEQTPQTRDLQLLWLQVPV